MKKEVVTIKGVHFSYVKGIEVLQGISFSVKEGEFIAILGANGAGKTTLLKLLLGKILPLKGTVKIYSTNIGYVPQKINLDQNHPAKVGELLMNRSLCSHLNLTHLLEKQFKYLSGGQQQRVLVALALQNDPDVLLLDEPTVGIDEKTRTDFYELLSHLSKKHNKTILLVTHDNDLVEKYASRMLCIDDQHHFSHARCVHD